MFRSLMALVLGMMLLAAACSTPQSGTSTGGSGTPSAGATSGPLQGYRNVTIDQLSPLVITTIAPNPIPVKGSDGKFHVDYELSVLNDSPRPATITKLETVADSQKGPVISSLSQDQVAALSLLTADYSVTAEPVTEIPAGRTLILVLDDVYATAGAVPGSVTHRITATFGPVAPGQADIANKYPDQVVQIGGPVTTSKAQPVLISPPVKGDGWLADNGLGESSLNAHRNVLVPVGGRINGAERFAVDWTRVDPSAKPLVEFRGDPLKNESYLAFDQPLLAVANGTVVSVVSDKPDITPGTIPTGIPFEQLTGNTIVLDLGNGVFALYAHMKQNSATVRVGDKVKKGQVIGRLGNSGNTSAAHLHFQLMRGPLPLTYDNIPWELDNFTLIGSATKNGVVGVPTAGTRTNEVPLGNSVSDFPSKGP